MFERAHGWRGLLVEPHPMIFAKVTRPKRIGKSKGSPCRKKVLFKWNSAFQSPLLKQTDALWELFSPKISKLFRTAVLNGYFDNEYGQTLFLDGILMDIMIDNGEIWCKLSALVMVYIH